MFNLPYISPSRDFIYDLGLKEHSVELKSHATEAFYREHGMNGLLSLWLMSGVNYIDYETDDQRVISWWINPENPFVDRVRKYLQSYSEQDARTLIQLAMTCSSPETNPYERPEGNYDFIEVQGSDLLTFIHTYFPQYPALAQVTNPLFHQKSGYCNGYDDTDYSHLFICNHLVQAFEEQPAALHYLALKGHPVDTDLLARKPISIDSSLVETLGLTPEEFYEAAIAAPVHEMAQRIDFTFEQPEHYQGP